MNTKYPFTSAGFADLQAALYALPDAELQAEANALLLDFVRWMLEHFELSLEQAEYLLGLSDETIAFNAYACSFALRHRLPVYLDKQEKPEQAGGSRGRVESEVLPDDKIKKIIETTNNLTVTEDEDGTTAGGSVTVKIEFITLTGGQ